MTTDPGSPAMRMPPRDDAAQFGAWLRHRRETVLSLTQADAWRVRWDLDPDPLTGERKQRQRSGFTTRRAARDWYDEHIAGSTVTYSDQTVGAYLQRWLTGHRYQIRPSTARRYEQAITSHIQPHLGHIKLRDLRADSIRAWHAAEVTAGIQASTIGFWHTILSTALLQAVRDGILATSPARHAPPPAVVNRVPEHWTIDEIHQFLTHCPVDLSGMVYRCALLTGLRPGELIALDWDALSIEERIIEIRATATIDNRGRDTIGPPKTRSSRRRVVMPEQLREDMRVYRRLWIAAKLEAGSTWYQDADVVFYSVNGRRQSHDTLSRRLRMFCQHVGIRPIKPHGLRHSWATWMLTLREHPAIVGAALGHQSISTTIDTYSHVSESMQREAAARLDDDLRQHGS